MSHDKFSVDEILEELKKNTQASPLDAEDVEKYGKDFQKYDTQALLDDILGHRSEESDDSTSSISQPVQTEPAQKPKAETTETDTSSSQKVKSEKRVPESVLTRNPMLDLTSEDVLQNLMDQINGTESTANQSLKQNDVSSTSAPKESTSPTASTEKKPPQIQQETVSVKGESHPVPPTTAQLKYINLKKSREQLVKDFVLDSDFTDSSYKNLSAEEINGNLTIHPKEPDESEETNEEISDVSSDEKKRDTEKEDRKRLLGRWKEKINEEAEEEQLQPLIEEYTSKEQTDQILSELQQMKRTLKLKGIILLVIFVCSLGLTVLNELFDPVPISFFSSAENPMLYCLLQTILLLGIFITCFDTVKNGITELIRRRPGRNSIYSIALLMMMIFSVILLTSPASVNETSVQLYVPLSALCFLSMTGGRILGIKRILTNFLLVSGDYDKYSVNIMENQSLAEDFTKGVLNDFPVFVYHQKTPFLSHFFDESFSEDITDKTAKFTVPILCGIGLITAIAAFLLGNDIFVCMTILSGILMAGAGVLTFFVVNFPLYTCSKSLSKLGGAVLGYHAANEFNDVNSALLEATDLFEPDQVTLYGIKTFSTLPVDQVILNATSVLCETRSILAGVFLKIINNRKDFLSPVDTILYEDGMGISAWIKNSRVLIGSRELMINHNVPVPEEDYEKKFLQKGRQLVYLSTAGELNAIFVVGIVGSENIRNMLVDLYNNDIACVIRSVDPLLTRESLGKIFDMPDDAFRILPSRLHKDCADLVQTEEPLNGGVCDNGTFPAYLYSFLLGKRLNQFIRLGQILQYVAMGVAILLFVLFTAIPNGISQLSNVTLCIFEAICLLICLFLQRTNKL